MELVRIEEEPESTVYENFGTASARDAELKRRSGEDSKVTAAAPGVTLQHLVAVSFGLICILQAVLNISLRLALFSQHSLTEETDELKIDSGIEASFNSLAEERDALHRTLYDNLCKRENQTNHTSITSLTEERDELKGKLNNFTLQNHLLTGERDRLTRVLINTAQTGWVHFSGSAYSISSTTTTWQESRDYCLQKGADLMIINSKTEQDFANQFKRYMWIGLTDLQTEGTWKWVDGTPLETSYWIAGEPNGASAENCGNIKNFNSQNSWNDERCSVSLFGMCEKKLSS